MRASITQEMPYGCGIACFAFVTKLSYKQAEEFLGTAQAQSNRFFVKNFREELNRFGLIYQSRHLRSSKPFELCEGSIVLLRRSKQFPVGHYLTYHHGVWMDPWINLPTNNDITQARSGFRDRLPGEAMYVLEPVSESALI